MENSSFKLEGAKEVMAALKALPVDLQAKILNAFLRKTGKKFISDELKSALNYSDKTESNIKVTGDARNKLSVSAGVMTSGYKLRWADIGTKERKTKKGANRGQILGKNEIQPTIESQIEPIANYAQEELGNEINKILERRLRRLKKS